MLFHSSMADQPQMEMESKQLKTNNINKESTSALEAEVRFILRNKKKCTYKPYECNQFTLDGYQFCLKHILQDKSAPFKQCSYTYTNNGKRCQSAAPKIDKKDQSFCNEHAMKTLRNKQNAKYPPPQTPEVLLHSLSHYVKKPRKRSISSSTYQSDEGAHSTSDEGNEQKTRSLDPFKDIDVTGLNNSLCNKVLDLCSESDSDVEASTFATVWHDFQGDSSDNESIDSEHEDPLKHADAYSAEEITTITRDKLIRLQSLYIEQYQHLYHIFKENKRKYINSLKREKETCCNIYNQSRENPKEQKLYKKLKSYKDYHKTHGEEAILNQRVFDLRSKITEGHQSNNSKLSNSTKCSFTEGGVKCGEKALPGAKHCRKHILEDSAQVLFRMCGKKCADVECTTPVEAIFEDSTCRLHMDIPPIRSYNQTRKNSESDFDDSIENLSQTTDLSTSLNVKTELLDYKPDLPRMKTLPTILFEESALDNFQENSQEMKMEIHGEEDCDDNSSKVLASIENDYSQDKIEEEINRKDENLTNNKSNEEQQVVEEKVNENQLDDKGNEDIIEGK